MYTRDMHLSARFRRHLWSRFRRRPRIVLGSAGPFIGGRDLGWRKYSLPLDDFVYHSYICGKSGYGKSQFLLWLQYQLIVQGQGLALIDPHSDLATDLLKLLAYHPLGPQRKPWLANPANARQVIYVEPGRTDRLVPMNLLTGHTAPYKIAQSVIEAFKRTWSESLASAPQFENVTLHSLLLLIEHDLSLVELPKLLLDKSFLDQLLRHSRQPEIVSFFRHRFGRWGKDQAVRVESLLNKVTALTLNDNLRLCLGARENRINMRRIMDTGQVIIVNLGTCDRETRRLLGSLLTVGLEQAALSRADIPERERRPFYAVIDEFASFVTNDGSAQVLSEILSEVRKYKVRLCLAHQGIHQLESSSRLVGALDQAQIKVIFGSGTKTGRVIADDIFSPDPDKIKHEVDDTMAQTRTHPQYQSLAEQKEIFVQSIKNQRKRDVFVLPPDSDQAIPLRTVTVPQLNIDPAALDAVKASLLRQVGESPEQIRSEIEARQRQAAGQSTYEIRTDADANNHHIRCW